MGNTRIKWVIGENFLDKQYLAKGLDIISGLAIERRNIENILNQIPANKMGNSQQIADLALFLASSKGDYITGQTISVDGGLYMS